MRALVLAAFGAVAPVGPVAAELDPTEQAIAEWVDTEIAGAEALIEQLVNINSGTLNREGVRAVGDILAHELAELGFSVEWIDSPEGSNRAGHLFARRAGDRGEKVLLIGHLDTVFERDDPFQTFVREGDWARGPGTEDMKGGDVVILYALAALATCQEITYRLHAAALGIPLRDVSVKLEGDIDLRGFFGVNEGVRPGFTEIRGSVRFDSSATPQQLERLKEVVDAHCPVLDLFRNSTPVRLQVASGSSDADLKRVA